MVHHPGLRVKARPLGNGLVEGYLIAWGKSTDADLEGQFFTPRTELRLDYFPDYPLLFHHGFDGKLGLDPIGRVKTLKRDDVGLWVQAQIDLANKYAREVYGTIKQHQFGWSSGSIDHLVKIAPDGEILVWPLFEGSITPTPAQPHKTTVRAMKAVLPESDPVHVYLAQMEGISTKSTQIEGEPPMPRKSTLQFVRNTLKTYGYRATEEDVEAIAADLDEDDTVMMDGLDEDDGAVSMDGLDDDDDAVSMDGLDEDDDAVMMDGLDDDEDAVMMDGLDEDDDAVMAELDDDEAVEAMMAELDDDEAGEKSFRAMMKKLARRRRSKARTKTRGRKSYTEKLEDRVAQLEQMTAPGEDQVGQGRVRVVQDAADQPKAYKSAFVQYIRFGLPNMNETQRYILRSGERDMGSADSHRNSDGQAIKALNTSTSGSIGFAVPDDFVRELNRNIMVDAVTAAECKVRQTSSDRVLIPDLITSDGRRAYSGSVSWPGESPANQAASAISEITLGQIQLPIHVSLVSTTSTLSALEDAAFDLQEMISESFAEAIAKEYEELIWGGDGQGKMSGIVNDTRVTGSASTAVSSVSGYLASGKAATMDDPDVIRSMLLQLPPGYRKRAKWFMNSNTADIIAQIKDANGRYLWGDDQGLNQGIPASLLNRPIVYNEFADDIAANAFPLILGDLSRGYTIGKRIEFSIRRFDDSAYAVQDQALFLGRARLGGQVTQPAAIKVLKIATS